MPSFFIDSARTSATQVLPNSNEPVEWDLLAFNKNTGYIVVRERQPAEPKTIVYKYKGTVPIPADMECFLAADLRFCVKWPETPPP